MKVVLTKFDIYVRCISTNVFIYIPAKAFFSETFRYLHL